jgi:TIR domain
MQRPKIFISHITEERIFANKLKEWIDESVLGSVDFFVSSDNSSIPLGAEWFNKIKTSLESSNIIIVLISHKSKDRKWIYFESGAGYIRGIPVIPVCIGGISKGELPSPLNSLQAIELPNLNHEKMLIDIIAKSAGLRTPKILEKLQFPKTIITEEKNSNILVDNIDDFLESIHLSEIKIDILSFFCRNIESYYDVKFTLSEIENLTNLKLQKRRKYILKTLENFSKKGFIVKINENNSAYWKFTEYGVKTLKDVKNERGLTLNRPFFRPEEDGAA